MPEPVARRRRRREMSFLDFARRLHGAGCLLATTFKTCWLHAKDPLMSTGTDGWLTGRERFDGQDVEVGVEAAEELAAAHVRMDPKQACVGLPTDVRSGAEATTATRRTPAPAPPLGNEHPDQPGRRIVLTKSKLAVEFFL